MVPFISLNSLLLLHLSFPHLPSKQALFVSTVEKLLISSAKLEAVVFAAIVLLYCFALEPVAPVLVYLLAFPLLSCSLSSICLSW